jgi:hypothetical protein
MKSETKSCLAQCAMIRVYTVVGTKLIWQYYVRGSIVLCLRTQTLEEMAQTMYAHMNK